jgi:hypothetical protein
VLHETIHAEERNRITFRNAFEQVIGLDLMG